jgi:hypothetical protein
MRKFLFVVGRILFVAGLLATLAGSVLARKGHVSGGILFWAGVTAVVTGAAISSAAQNRTCPNCLNRINAKETVCPACRNVVIQ